MIVGTILRCVKEAHALCMHDNDFGDLLGLTRPGYKEKHVVGVKVMK